MSFLQFRVKNNKKIIQFLPFLILAVLCLFIYLDGNVLNQKFQLGAKGFLYVSFFVFVAFIPTISWFFYSLPKLSAIDTKDTSSSLLKICYLTVYILFIIDITLVTFMPVKFCGVIGQVGFTLAYLVLGNCAHPKIFCRWNLIYTLTAVIAPTIENRFTPSFWNPEELIRMPGEITAPSIVFLMLGVTLINFFTRKDAMSSYKNFEDLKYITTHDLLTGALNRSSLTEDILQKKYFIMGDIDKFKNINDTHGHTVGDQCLIKFVKIIKNNLKLNEKIIRYGGEEFVIILESKTLEEAETTANKLRQKIEEGSKDILRFTVSFGLSFFEGGSLVDNIRRADSFLYVAKSSGRNMVCSENGVIPRS